MGQLAFVFPGQGAQSPGMGKALYGESPAARAVLDRAEALRPGLLSLCFEGPMETLTLTENAQPALFVVSLAAAATAEENGLKPQALAGFSLGEWSAVTHAGMLPFETAFPLLLERGRLMQACAERAPGGMAAILRKTAPEVRELLTDFPSVYPVNYNAPDQVVVAAEHKELERFLAFLGGQGVRAMKLKVSGAFHSLLMLEAGQKLLPQLRGKVFRHPAVPVYSNLTARPYQEGQEAETLARQLCSPVRWEESVQALAAAGITDFLELGPGRVLSGLITKILPQARVHQADSLAGLINAKEAMGGSA